MLSQALHVAKCANAGTMATTQPPCRNHAFLNPVTNSLSQCQGLRICPQHRALKVGTRYGTSRPGQRASIPGVPEPRRSKAVPDSPRALDRAWPLATKQFAPWLTPCPLLPTSVGTLNEPPWSVSFPAISPRPLTNKLSQQQHAARPPRSGRSSPLASVR